MRAFIRNKHRFFSLVLCFIANAVCQTRDYKESSFFNGCMDLNTAGIKNELLFAINPMYIFQNLRVALHALVLSNRSKAFMAPLITKFEWSRVSRAQPSPLSTVIAKPPPLFNSLEHKSVIIAISKDCYVLQFGSGLI